MDKFVKDLTNNFGKYQIVSVIDDPSMEEVEIVTFVVPADEADKAATLISRLVLHGFMLTAWSSENWPKYPANNYDIPKWDHPFIQDSILAYENEHEVLSY